MIRDAATSGIAETSESDVPLACAATPSRSRRNDVDEDTAAATARKKMTPQRPEQRSEVPEHRGPQRKKDCGWRLWWYASSFKPPRSPAGRQPQHPSECKQPFLCALIHDNAKDLSKVKAVVTLSTGLSITKYRTRRRDMSLNTLMVGR